MAQRGRSAAFCVIGSLGRSRPIYPSTLAGDDRLDFKLQSDANCGTERIPRADRVAPH